MSNLAAEMHPPIGRREVAGDGRSPRRHAARRYEKALSLLGLIALWWCSARAGASPQLLPGPDLVFDAFVRLVRSGELPINTAITLARVAIAFALAMTVGSAIGFLAGRSARVDALVDPWLVVGLNLPVLVVIVLAYIWIGLNDVAAITAVVIAKMPTVVVTIREGARAFDPRLDDLAAVYRIRPLRRLRTIALPQLTPYLAAAGRSGLSITWKIVLIVELLGRPNGVGFELNLQFQNFDVAAILAYGLSFAAIMLVVEAALLQPWERRANAWRRNA